MPISAPVAPVRAPSTVSMARTPPHPASSANIVAAATRHHRRRRRRRRRPRINTPMLPITLGMRSPSPNTKLDKPLRSPGWSGATSTGFEARWIDREAAVSAPVIACCCRTPAAPAVTSVTAPVRGTISAPALDCERTL